MMLIKKREGFDIPIGVRSYGLDTGRVDVDRALALATLGMMDVARRQNQRLRAQ
jgi:hypothetical protein